MVSIHIRCPDPTMTWQWRSNSVQWVTTWARHSNLSPSDKLVIRLISMLRRCAPKNSRSMSRCRIRDSTQRLTSLLWKIKKWWVPKRMSNSKLRHLCTRCCVSQFKLVTHLVKWSMLSNNNTDRIWGNLNNRPYLITKLSTRLITHLQATAIKEAAQHDATRLSSQLKKRYICTTKSKCSNNSQTTLGWLRCRNGRAKPWNTCTRTR